VFELEDQLAGIPRRGAKPLVDNTVSRVYPFLETVVAISRPSDD